MKRLSVLFLSIFMAGCSSLPFVWTRVKPYEQSQNKADQQAIHEQMPTVASADFDPDLCEWVTVKYVNDGDTIQLRNDKVRIVGIDTPEVDGPHTDAEHMGDEASAFARSLISRNDRVCLLRVGRSDRDQYDRLLRYVHLADGTDFGQQMLETGLATVYRTQQHPRRNTYQETEKAAKNAQIGVWK